MVGLADRAGGLLRIHPSGSWITQPGKYSALWFRCVVRSAVVICFLSVPGKKGIMMAGILISSTYLQGNISLIAEKFRDLGRTQG